MLSLAHLIILNIIFYLDNWQKMSMQKKTPIKYSELTHRAGTGRYTEKNELTQIC